MSQELAQEIQKIHERNARVSADKAWEGSFWISPFNAHIAIYKIFLDQEHV